ncbi:NtaA/DmoA family FMN-dependent monooxygenase [Nakamurella leprariae]|uniref:NtaA/DmoA family FMN-dependent monooxygenase n=1 Tax=Nakamurella leprariae TaxID=2803911 RepID=A0A938YD91_9ACTN|nr:NtaA/DmoA family FMN-dependent monooxygenase [Nakamurella leprariae]MBM9467473.1 NtaA/DmoA family FMN-dependent monooxygenase [Nakamurella leprariae]
MTNRQQIHLGLISTICAGGTAWRHPAADPAGATQISAYVQEAQLAERGLFDLYFLADSSGLRTDPPELWSRRPFFHNALEPITALAAVATRTERIGLGGTATTTYYEPYHIARFFQSLDHISNGRSAWNAVTSANAFISLNFGQQDLLAHGSRYDRAREFLKAVDAFWETWDEDAFVYDKAEGTYYSPDKLHPVWFQGEHVQVLGGGLNIERGPQGKPVIIQAGGSPDGRQLAAESAEVVFSGAKTVSEGRAYNEDVRSRMVAVGRDPEGIKLLPSITVVVAETAAQAQEDVERMRGLADDETSALAMAVDLEVDVRGLPLDAPIPRDLIPASAKYHSQFFQQIVAKIDAENPTLRELARWYGSGRTVHGTATTVVDVMEEWVTGGAADGFIVHVEPGGLQSFVDLVIPELQRREMYRTEYRGTTLRDHLGLPVPTSRSLADGLSAR